MSSEYLEDVDYDDNMTTVMLTLKASGDAFLFVSGEVDYYHLPPNEKGWSNAQKIIDAMTEWVAHSRRIHGQQPGDNE